MPVGEYELVPDSEPRNNVTSPESDVVPHLLKLDLERCRLISERDYKRLAELMADDMVQVHASGRREDKAGYLESLRTRPRLCRRGGQVEVRIYGDAAVMTGFQYHTFGENEPAALITTMVWVRQGGAWKLASSQSTSAVPA